VLRAAAGAVGAAALALLLAGCTTGDPPEMSTGSLEPPEGPAFDKRRQVKVALIVPLSAQGHASLIGKSLKQAAELALFERDSPNLQLMVKDDKGTPEGARAAADEAIKDGAALILGPVFAKSVTAVAPVARQAGVPAIAFSNDRQVAGGGVYLLSFQPSPEVARIVAFAAQQGKRRFAALIPDDQFGKIAAASFKTAVAQRGGVVVALETYRPSANAMLEPMRKLSDAIKASYGEDARVDALFVPGAQESLETIARLLPQAEIDTERIKLIGTGGMDYPNAGREAKLVGAWYPAPDPRGWNEFAQKYARSYGQAPPRIATLAYDGIGVAIALAGEPEGQRYTATTITRPAGFSGVDGTFRFLADGTTDRALAILEVQKFGASVIDAPASPSPARAPTASNTGSGFLQGLFNLN
jgi:ABC-type branched-subunit amino acid transport system substrate-binding protein